MYYLFIYLVVLSQLSIAYVHSLYAVIVYMGYVDIRDGP